MKRPMKQKIEILLRSCRQKSIKIRTAESCTAGAVAAEIASVSGASDVLDRGWITYSNQAKMDELSVPKQALEVYGAVSQQVVEAMAEGGCDKYMMCVALSGIAGPSGGSVEKPVGTVWIAVAYGNADENISGNTYVQSHCYHFDGQRSEVQNQAVEQAIQDMMTVCSGMGEKGMQ